MPTARELLEQADALMRRNRGGDTGVPVLTDVVPDELEMPSRGGPSTRERTGPASRGPAAEARAPRDWVEPNEANRAVENAQPEDATRAAVPEEGSEQAAEPAAPAPAPDIDVLAAIDDAELDLEPPLLTDVVEEFVVDLAPLPPGMAESEPSIWPGADTIDPALHSITGPGPDTVGVVPPVRLRVVEPYAET